MNRLYKYSIQSLNRIPRKYFSNALDPKKSMRGPMTYISLGLFTLVGGGLLFYYQLEKEKITQKVASDVTTSGKAALGGTWTLVDQDGVPRTDDSYKGSFQLLYFGFTYCPDICPNELVKLGKIVDEAAKHNIKVKPIFISVDPARDTVRQLKEYSKDFHPTMVYLTGTRDQILKATRAYRVYFSKVDENADNNEDYLVDHSIVMYFLSPSGEFMDFFTQKMTISDIIDKIKTYKK